MMPQSKTRRCKHRSKLVAPVRTRPEPVLPEVLSKEAVAKRRHQKISLAAYRKWENRLRYKLEGDSISEWLAAELEVDTDESNAKKEWVKYVYQNVIGAFHYMTEIPIDQINRNSPVPADSEDRQLMYSFIYSALQNMPMDPDDPEDGYAETLGELFWEVLYRFPWMPYTIKPVSKEASQTDEPLWAPILMELVALVAISYIK
jgi:hypothetical protein